MPARQNSGENGKAGKLEELPWFRPSDRREWRQWLADNHQSAAGVWLVYFKKSAGQPTISYDEAVEEALCFGWIDSKVMPIDDARYRQLVTPRKAKSVWSALNKRRIESLRAAGLMTPAGLAVVESAQRDGSWMTLDAVEALVIPDDLGAALADDPLARKHFEGFAPSARKVILQWIASAKRPPTRAARVAKTVADARMNRRAFG